MIDREKFYKGYRSKFGKLKQIQVDTLNAIMDFFETDPKLRFDTELAYVMATAYHEANLNAAIREIGRGKGRKYGQPHFITGQIYYGRGLCQLTWYFNYASFSDILGIDLINDPDLALIPENSVKILMIGMRDGIFTRHKLNMYFDEDTTDWLGARKIINGTDRAALIKGYAKKFLTIIENAIE